MKAFITGGSGFIGRAIIPKLIDRGYEAKALARSERSQTIVKELGAEPIAGGLSDVEIMKEAMQGCDLVLHVAGQYKYGVEGTRNMDAVNVRGTEDVLRTAWEVGVPKILYTSTIAVLGDTKGEVVDETHLYQGPPWPSDYDRTKWLAHHKVAQPLIDQGAPIINLMPGAVYGFGDTSLVGEMLYLYYKGLLRNIFPGPETVLSFVHVDDVAEGHILAAEKGKIGENYLLTGEIMSLGELSQIWAEILGRKEPAIYVPARLLHKFIPMMSSLDKKFSLPQFISGGAIGILGVTYMASSEKTQNELGWQSRSVKEGMREVFELLSKNEEPYLLSRQQKQALLAVSTMLLILVSSRKRKRNSNN